ncbi:uncharacterized protein HD556DRAFT_1248118, partial [Suillus plorans]
MLEHQDDPVRLRIWQQNLNNSRTAQESLLNGPKAKFWDLLALQEPCSNKLRNTKSTRQWHSVYPTQHFTHLLQRTRAVTLVSAALDTNGWKQLAFPSSDVIIIQFSGPFGKCTVFNIYNDGERQDTL